MLNSDLLTIESLACFAELKPTISKTWIQGTQSSFGKQLNTSISSSLQPLHFNTMNKLLILTYKKLSFWTLPSQPLSTNLTKSTYCILACPTNIIPTWFHHWPNVLCHLWSWTLSTSRPCIQGLEVSKACGPDKISVQMLKYTVSSIAPSVIKLFNLSIHLGRIPDCWKEAMIVPIPKSTSKSSDPDQSPSPVFSL